RDISHSSVERIALPDASIAVDYMLHIATRLASGLIVNRDRMLANLESSGGLIYTSAVLLELVEAGLSREDAYALVQTAAMQTWNSGTPCRETLRTEAAAAGQQLNERQLDTVCDPQRYVERLAPTFDRLAQLA
ncbi:MAG: adenylosuccinate lyase, partial [Antricoccus sp.]